MFDVGKTQIAYRKDEVWLVKLVGIYLPMRIIEIAGGRVRHFYGWDSAEKWHRRAKTRLGRVRRIYGIPFGWRR